MIVGGASRAELAAAELLRERIGEPLRIADPPALLGRGHTGLHAKTGADGLLDELTGVGVEGGEHEHRVALHVHELVEGGVFDEETFDGGINNPTTLTDQGGPGAMAMGGGVPIPVLGPWMIWLMGFLMSGVAWLGLRRREKA